MTSPADPKPVHAGKARGRPRVEARMEPITTNVPMPVYDALVREALHRDVSVSALVRQLLIVRLPKA